MTNLTCSAMLFDLDGILVDSLEKIQQHWSRWALAHGVDPQRAVEASHGRSSVQTVELLAPCLDARAEAEQIEAEQGKDTEGLQRIPGALEMVSALPQAAWAVVTSGKLETALARLAFGDLPRPTVLVTADDVSRMKPDPDGYLMAAHTLGVKPEECLVVEDSVVGIAAAKSAGMRVVAVAKTYPIEALSAADLIALSLSDLEITQDNHTSNRFHVHLRSSTR
jgi:mannitol-1-/sugar-/sorbitol-6-phosphatase